MSSTSLQLYFSGDAYFKAALAAIDQAQDEVFIESYIFDLDPIGLRFLNALSRAKDRGVQVRLLVDGIGSFNWLRDLQIRCQKAQIPLRIYHPLPLWPRLRFSWRALRRWLLLFRRINQRNHRKVIIIDEKKVFLGSLNITQVHAEEFMGGKAWRDTGVEMDFQTPSSDLQELREAFLVTWRKCQGHRMKVYPRHLLKRLGRLRAPQGRFRLNSRIWWRFFLMKDLLNRIRLAKTRILITNAYFLPRRPVLIALRRAARRGVQVGLCLPEKSDHWFMREVARSLYHRLLKGGVKIYEYKPRVLHAKTIVVDDWAAVGSYNLNHRSLLHDLEVETIVTETPLIEQLVSQWEIDVKESRAVSPREIEGAFFLRRWSSQIIFWFRYWL